MFKNSNLASILILDSRERIKALLERSATLSNEICYVEKQLNESIKTMENVGYRSDLVDEINEQMKKRYDLRDEYRQINRLLNKEINDARRLVFMASSQMSI